MMRLIVANELADSAAFRLPPGYIENFRRWNLLYRTTIINVTGPFPDDIPNSSEINAQVSVRGADSWWQWMQDGKEIGAPILMPRLDLRYRRRVVDVEAWQNDDLGPAMPYWLDQISARERGGVVRVKTGAATSVPAQLGDYVVLYPAGHIAVMDPGSFEVEFETTGQRHG